MRDVLLAIALLLPSAGAVAQAATTASVEELLMDRQAGAGEEGETTDEGLAWDRGQRLRRKVHLNRIDAEELGELLGLTPLQVNAFDTYRRRLGPFIDPLELQSVPGWDAATVRRVMPWATVEETASPRALLAERLRAGEHVVLLRTGRSTADAEAHRAARVTPAPQAGGPAQVLLRYGFRSGNLLQWGITVEKDAGEGLPGRGGAPRADFVSGHVSLRDWGRLRTLVAGDFQVNLGQGLTHWQGMAFRKTSEAMLVMRQAAPLRPHAGTDENRFHRGLGAEWGRGRWTAMAFVSARGLDANRVDDTSGLQESHVSSLLTSGLHRDAGELEDRHALPMQAAGGRVMLRTASFRLGLNAVRFRFGLPIRKDPLPYNLHALSGRDASNLSVDYGLTMRNLHLFGEAAVDRRGGPAIVQGLMASLHPRLDLAWVFRGISPRYRALQANAFTEQAEPGNETGNYLGLCLRLPGGWKADAWLDLYRFPWLRYRVDRPSSGQGALMHVAWTPDRRTELLFRWQHSTRGQNATDGEAPLASVMPVPQSGTRFQFTYHPGPEWMARLRLEGSRARVGRTLERGFLMHMDLRCKPSAVPLQLMGRLTLYETGGYASRIYGFENDVPYRSAMAVFHGRGARAYLVAGWRGRGGLTVSAKCGWWPWREASGSRGMDIRLQALYGWSPRGRSPVD
jgi:hypothetical protein